MGLEGLEGTMHTWCSEMTELGQWRTGDAISHDIIYTVLDTHIYCMYLFIWKYKYIFLHLKVDFFIRPNSRRCFEIVAKLFFLYELLITAMILWWARKIVISYCKCMKNAIRLCDFNRFVFKHDFPEWHAAQYILQAIKSSIIIKKLVLFDIIS